MFAFRQDYTGIQAPALAFYAVTAKRALPAELVTRRRRRERARQSRRMVAGKGPRADRSTLEVMERMLSRAGHRVTTAVSVAGALKMAGADRFDAVISDLGLPDGTGFELMEKLRVAHGLRGIALSGYGMDEDLRRSHEAGFGAHLTKPIDFAQLERALEDVMAQASPAAGPTC